MRLLQPATLRSCDSASLPFAPRSGEKSLPRTRSGVVRQHRIRSSGRWGAIAVAAARTRRFIAVVAAAIASDRLQHDESCSDLGSGSGSCRRLTHAYPIGYVGARFHFSARQSSMPGSKPCVIQSPRPASLPVSVRQKLVIPGIALLSEKASRKCGYTSAPGIASTTAGEVSSPVCSCARETSLPRKRISARQKPYSRIWIPHEEHCRI